MNLSCGDILFALLNAVIKFFTVIVSSNSYKVNTFEKGLLCSLAAGNGSSHSREKMRVCQM